MDISFIVNLRRICSVVVFALSCVFWTTGASAQVELSINQTRALAQTMLAQGNFDGAVAVSNVLLERDPNDRFALITLARANAALGKGSAAGASLKRVYRLSDSKPERFALARDIAQLHFKQGQHGRAEWWLRRAANQAPDEKSQQMVRGNFKQVRRQNPLSVNLNFSISPNNNVNNGSSSETVTIWNLPFILSADAQALSGYEASLGIDLGYRISQNANQQTRLALALFGRSYELSGESKLAAPNVEGRDYSFYVAEASLTQRRLIFKKAGTTEFGLLFGKNWYGGEPLSYYDRVTVTQNFNFSKRTRFSLSGRSERQTGLTGAQYRSRIKALDASVTHILNNGDQVRFSLGQKIQHSEDQFAEYRALKKGVSYSFAKPILGTSVSVSVGQENRNYDLSRYDIDGRQDKTLTVGLSLVFANVDYFGFSPSVNINSSQTSSNIDLFNRESLGVRFGFRSTF